VIHNLAKESFGNSLVVAIVLWMVCLLVVGVSASMCRFARFTCPQCGSGSICKFSGRKCLPFDDPYRGPDSAIYKCEGCGEEYTPDILAEKGLIKV